jgi:hypothetical protein
MRLPTNELLEGAWCTWCNHGMRDDQQIAHMARMSNDQLDVTIVRTDGAIAGYVLLDSFCDDMKKIHMVNSLLQERFRVSPEDNTLPPRGNEYMLLPSVICYDYEEEEEEEEEGQLEPIVCQVMRQSKVRYDIDELLKELRRHRWNVPQIIEAENYMCW